MKIRYLLIASTVLTSVMAAEEKVASPALFPHPVGKIHHTTVGAQPIKTIPAVDFVQHNMGNPAPLWTFPGSPVQRGRSFSTFQPSERVGNVTQWPEQPISFFGVSLEKTFRQLAEEARRSSLASIDSEDEKRQRFAQSRVDELAKRERFPSTFNESTLLHPDDRGDDNWVFNEPGCLHPMEK